MSEEICDICNTIMMVIPVPFMGINIHNCHHCNAEIDIGNYISNTDWNQMHHRI